MSRCAFSAKGERTAGPGVGKKRRRDDDLKRLCRDLDRPGAGWEGYYSWARSHRITPLLYWYSREADGHAFAAPFIERCKEDYLRSSVRGLVLLTEARTVESALARAAIRFIPLKGLVLATTIYPDPGLRPFSDIDLLVDRDDLPAIRRLLFSAGYVPLDELRPGFAETFTNSIAFIKKDAAIPIVIEVHWHLVYFPTYVPSIRIEELWASARPASVNGVQALALAPEHHLIELCLHYYVHAGKHLIWLVDIALLYCFNQPILDWRCLEQTARRFKLEEPVGRVMREAGARFHLPLPGSINELRGVKGDARAKALEILSRNPENTGLASLLNLMFVPGLAGKLSFLAATLFPRSPGRETALKQILLKSRRAARALTGFSHD